MRNRRPRRGTAALDGGAGDLRKHRRPERPRSAPDWNVLTPQTRKRRRACCRHRAQATPIERSGRSYGPEDGTRPVNGSDVGVRPMHASSHTARGPAEFGSFGGRMELRVRVSPCTSSRSLIWSAGIWRRVTALVPRCLVWRASAGIFIGRVKRDAERSPAQRLPNLRELSARSCATGTVFRRPLTAPLGVGSVE
jgi:hypothetical protein